MGDYESTNEERDYLQSLWGSPNIRKAVDDLFLHYPHVNSAYLSYFGPGDLRFCIGVNTLKGFASEYLPNIIEGIPVLMKEDIVEFCSK